MNNRDVDKSWYENESRKKGVEPWCPYARDRSCRRYFMSRYVSDWSLNAKDIDPEEKVLKFWNPSDPHASGPDSPETIGSPGDPQIIKNFCPEVSFEHFDRFEADFTVLSDPQHIHYTECSEYVALRQGSSQSPSVPASPVSADQTSADSNPGRPPEYSDDLKLAALKRKAELEMQGEAGNREAAKILYGKAEGLRIREGTCPATSKS